MRQFSSASLIVTEKCNLSCKYCFENHCRQFGPDMDDKTAIKIVQFLFDQASMMPSNRHVGITLFGGEPLLNFSVCKTIVNKGIELSKEMKIPFKPGIITNGTIMNDEIELEMFRWKSQCGFSIQVSIDGCEEAQNLYRVRKDGTSSYSEVEKNIPAFERLGPVCLHGCLNKKTLPMLYKSYRHFIDKFNHKGAIWFMPVHSEKWNSEDVKIYDEQLQMIFEHETKTLGTVSAYTPIDKLLPCGGNYRHPEKTCGAGTNYLSFTGNGDIYPCHNFYFSQNQIKQDMLVGNVFDDIPLDEKILKPFQEFTQEKLGCAQCPNTACYRCIADNMVFCGDITKQIDQGGFRCKLSSVEKKYQDLAVKWAEEHATPKNNNLCSCSPSNSDYIKLFEETKQNLLKLEKNQNELRQSVQEINDAIMNS